MRGKTHGKFQQPELNWLVLTQHFAACNAEKHGVADGAGGAALRTDECFIAPALVTFVLRAWASKTGLPTWARAWSVEPERGRITLALAPSNRYCEHIGRPHRSNGTMLRIDVRRACFAQSCYDPECRAAAFHSSELPIPPELLPTVNPAVSLAVSSAAHPEADAEEFNHAALDVAVDLALELSTYSAPHHVPDVHPSTTGPASAHLAAPTITPPPTDLADAPTAAAASENGNAGESSNAGDVDEDSTWLSEATLAALPLDEMVAAHRRRGQSDVSARGAAAAPMMVASASEVDVASSSWLVSDEALAQHSLNWGVVPV